MSPAIEPGMKETVTSKTDISQPAETGRGIEGSVDPFAAQRTDDNSPFGERQDSVGGIKASPLVQSGSPMQDRRLSKEWDASKVPPSRFQKREGSIYATPSSRDGHVDRNQQTAYFEKLKEKKWFK